MLARIQECILYRDFSDGEILDNIAEIINLYESDEEALRAKENQFFQCVNGLVDQVRSAEPSKAASMTLQKMISGYSKSCTISTSLFLIKYLEPYAAG